MEFEHNAMRREHMLHDPMHKLIPAVAVPSIITMLIGSIYNMADTFFVGKLGTSASGAVGIVMPIMNLLQACSFIFAHGASSYVSRLLGQNEQERAARTIVTALFSAMALGLFYGLAGLMWMEPFLRMFGATDTILPYASDYARYIYIASPFFAGSYVLNNTLRAEGSATKAMLGMGAGAVLNIILDPIFIFPLGMGVAGAGVATMIGQLFGFSILISMYVRNGKRSSAIKISPKHFTLELKMYWELVRVGVPSFVRMGLNSVAIALLNNAAAIYGDSAIAGFSIASRILMLASSALIGYGQGYQPISGYNFGAKKYRRVESAFRFTLITSVLFMVVVSILLYLLAPNLVVLFRDDPAVIATGTRALRLSALALPLAAVTAITGMLFQSTGRALSSFVLSASRQGLFFAPLVLILPRFFGLEGIMYSQPAADVLAFFTTSILLFFGIRDLKILQKTESEPLPGF